MKCPFCLKELPHKYRTTPENKYYWGVVIDLLSDELGYTPEEMHEILKIKFLCYKIHLKHKDGSVEEITYGKTTKDLTTKEFEEYLTKIRTWASADLGILIPLPNEGVI